MSYIYVQAYMPLSNGGFQPYWALVNSYNYFRQNVKPMKRYVFRISLRPDSWNFYSISQNASSKREAINHIMASQDEINSHYMDPSYNYFNTINNLGADTIDYECILKHYNFILRQLDACKPDIFNIQATEWVSSLA